MLWWREGATSFAKGAFSRFAANPPKKPRVSDVDNIIKSFESLDKNDLSRIAFALGRNVSKEIDDDIDSVKFLYKDKNYIQNFDPKTYLNKRNSVLTNFAMGAAGINSIDGNEKRSVHLVSSIDCLYKCRNLNYISPLHFATNLIVYNVSGSKLLCNTLAKMLPAGSYCTITKWLDSESQVPLGRSSPGWCYNIFWQWPGVGTQLEGTICSKGLGQCHNQYDSHSSVSAHNFAVRRAPLAIFMAIPKQLVQSRYSQQNQSPLLHLWRKVPGLQRHILGPPTAEGVHRAEAPGRCSCRCCWFAGIVFKTL